MAGFKMTTKRYMALRQSAWERAEQLGRLTEARKVNDPEVTALLTERGILLNAIDALDSHFPVQRADAAQQALRELSKGKD